MSSLTYRGSFVLNDGYGRISNNIVLELLQRNWDISLSDINEDYYTKARAHPLIALNYDQLFTFRNTEYQINHFPPNSYPPRVSSRTKTLLYTTFETTQPPIEWKRRIEKTSTALAVTSEWVKGVFQSALDIQVPVYVLHHGFAQPEYGLLDIAEKWSRTTPLRFLMVAANPFDDRKNGWGALRAFQLAFPESEGLPVEFWIIGHGMPNLHTNDKRLLFIRGDLSDGALHKMYEMCHVLVAPSRGEGFGLPIFEAMHYGVIPIVTDWSTPGSLLTSDMAYKIPVRELRPVLKGKNNPFMYMFFGAKNNLGYWAEPSFPNLVDSLRRVYEERHSQLARAELAAKYVSKFTIPRMVDDLEAIFHEL